MKIWYGTLLVANFILTGYVVMIIERHLPALTVAAGANRSYLKQLEKKLDQQTELLTSLQADLKKSAKAPEQPGKPAAPDPGKLAVDSLRDSVSKLAEADAKKQAGDINAAIDLVKGVKAALWKAGDVLPTHQKTLRALMGPLDLITEKWKKGDKSEDTSKIAEAVRAILQKIDNKVDA